MMSKTAIAQRLRDALAKELKRDAATIEPGHKLREDLGLNSLDAIELMFKVEEEFDLAIPDADLQKLVTVGDLVTYIEGRLNHPGSGQPAAPAKAPAAQKTAKAPAARPAAGAKKASSKGRRPHG
jgi:acyl carrier protein